MQQKNHRSAKVRGHFWLFLLVLGVDQLSKFLFWQNILNVRGIFGLGGRMEWVVGAVLSLLLFAIWKTQKQNERFGLVILFSAGLSNFFDRMMFGGVRDFIWWPVLNVYGNLADLVLFVTVVWLLWNDFSDRISRR